MSDSDPSPYSPFAPLLVSYGEPVGFSDSLNPSSRPWDHRSQVSCRSQGSHTRTCAPHICGLPQLSLHGLGLPTPTPEVFHTSHRDGVQTIQGRVTLFQGHNRERVHIGESKPLVSLGGATRGPAGTSRAFAGSRKKRRSPLRSFTLAYAI